MVVAPVAQLEPGEDVRDVLLDGPLGDPQTLGDRRVRQAAGKQLEHLLLATRQRDDGLARARKRCGAERGFLLFGFVIVMRLSRRFSAIVGVTSTGPLVPQDARTRRISFK